MLNGLDLFSGISGLTIALREFVRPVAYCEIEPYAAAVLFSRMLDGSIPTAPIFPDVKHLSNAILADVDIICGGFPCQDISNAGLRKGLEGERSGLFFEIVRLASELRPRFVFLENVAAITVRGLERIISEWSALGYDCRWTVLSAAAVGAPHIRERWWLLAHAKGEGERREERDICEAQRRQIGEVRRNANGSGFEARGLLAHSRSNGRSSDVADTMRPGPSLDQALNTGSEREPGRDSATAGGWWSTEPDMGRVVDGLPMRVDRIKSLGNSVVPLCAKEAFKRLIGL